MRRRDFITLVGGASAAMPLVARAQVSARPVIGFLSIGSRDADTNRIDAFRRGLAEFGYVEGQSVAIEYRGAQYQHERLPALAADLAGRQVTVIVVVSFPGPIAPRQRAARFPLCLPWVPIRCNSAW
jgi:putative ABC transport system substrate-binding protein